MKCISRRKRFIEDNEAAFKFHPWQMSSTQDKLQKILHTELPERAIHHLWDTGTVREILNFSKNNGNPVKVQKLAQYLYAYLGLHICTHDSKRKTTSPRKQLLTRSQSHPKYTLTTDNLLKNSAETKTFEIKKLIETVAQELAFLSSITEENNLSVQYSLKIARYHMGSVKKQKLACCSYPSCLFNIRQKLWLNKQVNRKTIKKVAPPTRTLTFNRSNNNLLKQRQNKQLSRTHFQQRVNAANNQKNVTLVQRMQPNRVKPKRFTETATQTVPWAPESAPYSSSYQNSVRDISDDGEEDITESEEELYCKSDTLNDASMITEEIASDFVIGQSKINQNENEFSKSRKSLTVKETSNRSHTNQSSYLGSNLKTEVEARSSVNDSLTLKTRKSISNKRELSVNQSSEKENANVSANKSTRSKSKTLYNISRKLSDNIYLKRSDAIANSISRSQSLTPMKSNLIAVALKSLSSNKSSSKKSDQNVIPSLKRNSISIKDNSNSLKSTSQKEPAVDPSEVQADNTLDHQEKALENQEVESEEQQNEKLSEPEAEKPSEFQNETENNMNSLESSNGAIGEENGKIGENEVPNECPRVLSSSDNETTYLPVHSSSASGGPQEENSEASSSIKENDNTSPEYSSHWTEEYSSTEVSEAEIDESFQEKFLTYKEALLDEDDGIVASSEDETPSSDEHQVTEILCDAEETQKTLAEIIYEGNIEEFREQVKMEENITEIVDENGWNLLHLAAFKGFNDFIEELLNLGISIESTTKVGYTALHLAASNNHMECVRMLLRNGASLYSEDVNEEILPKITATASSPMRRLLNKYEENIRKVQTISHILNEFSKTKKNLSNGLSKNLLQTLADITLDEEDVENVSSNAE
ncbi:ANK_REP_REGION domain-containing protein [Nephila pilipes]|uniref:ANK_REP_REGION domain-containing protein n=1 Tax=Nephila pilipes TaxID=299642 RepID=A0A8X6N9T1_NEPPI|nr:ANK_REP_REGION domain-containing protein [Nephila pilipes]